MHNPAHATLRKALEVLQYLVDHRFGGTIEELAKEFDLSKRQVRRYLHAIEGAGVALECRRNGASLANVWRLNDRPRYARLMGMA